MKGVPVMKTSHVLMLICLVAAQTVVAGGNVTDLADELDSRRVTLEAAVGNGASSGNAVDGYLVNGQEEEMRVGVQLTRPLFLANGGRGQNMAATHVYLEDGTYITDGHKEFIPLKPKVRTRVSFVAYCVDFEKENPSQSDTFTLAATPANLTAVLGKIRAYKTANPSAKITVAAQAAIWMVQGMTMEKIRTKFDVSPADEQLARKLIN
jgi:hypothetical protein